MARTLCPLCIRPLRRPASRLVWLLASVAVVGRRKSEQCVDFREVIAATRPHRSRTAGLSQHNTAIMGDPVPGWDAWLRAPKTLFVPLGEISEPRRAVPFALAVGLLASMTVYILLQTVIVGTAGVSGPTDRARRGGRDVDQTRRFAGHDRCHDLHVRLALTAGSTMIVYAGICAALLRLRRTKPAGAVLRVPGGAIFAIGGIVIVFVLLTRLQAREILLMSITAAVATAN